MRAPFTAANSEGGIAVNAWYRRFCDLRARDSALMNSHGATMESIPVETAAFVTVVNVCYGRPNFVHGFVQRSRVRDLIFFFL